MKTFFISIILIILFVFFNSCDKVCDPCITMNPREYKWTIDTLYYPGLNQTLMNRVWGYAKNDVYLVGHNSEEVGDMFHFDGKKWTAVKIGTAAGGPIPDGNQDLYEIIGFSPNDVWAVGERVNYGFPPDYARIRSSFLIHYDGKKWSEVKLGLDYGLTSIWGGAPDNIIIGGISKYIINYNGFLWTKDSLPIDITKNEFFSLYCLTGTGDNLHAFGFSHQDKPFKEAGYWFKRENGKWNIRETYVTTADSYIDSAGLITRLWVSPEGNLYSVGYEGIKIWKNNKWEDKFDYGGVFPRFSNIFGISEINIFAVGTRGKIFHYNGNDWYQFKQFADFNINYYDIWTDGTEVFIVGQLSDGSKTIVLHGK